MNRYSIKSLIRYGLLGTAFVALFSIASCGGGDDTPQESPQEIAQALLENNWTIASGGSITLDGTSVSERYAGFSVDIGDGTFTTTNAGDLFPATGTWTWEGESDNQIITGNGKELTFTVLTANRFVFTFLKTDQNTAAGVPGNYTVTLTR